MKRMAIILIFAVLLGGCAGKSKTVHRVVTGVQVEYTRNGETLCRNYTQPASTRSVLTYLRILRPFGPVIPEGSHDSNCKITLQYSQGPDSVFLQLGDTYIQRDGGAWESIDSSHAALLYPLLLLLPSDSAENR